MSESTKHADYDISPEGVLRLRFSGDLSSGTVEEFRAFTTKRAHEAELLYNELGPLRALVDLSDMQSYHPKVLSILVTFCKEVERYFERTATYGATGAAAVARDIVLGLSGWKHVQSFETEADALAWLQADNP